MLRKLSAALALALPLLVACPSPTTVTAIKPPASAVPPAVQATSLAALTEGENVQGFVAQALYLDDDGRARGARLVHARTRFVFDYLAIESAPQAFVYATTYPSSDGGAPHTQEHLLLGKGNKGRWLGNYDHVMLAEWSAATWQYRTGYHFHTSAGTDAFWGILKTQLDALLHPDYSDEEIRREVRNFGVAKRPDGTLELDEKGTVYNEMVRTYESADTRAWDVMGRLLYGETHPLALSSGGTPEGIRGLTPEDIRRFHAAHYQLANMGMVGAFPSSVAINVVLAKVGEILDGFAPQADTTRYMTEADVPPAKGDTPGALRMVEYPHATADHPGPAMLAWPATRRLGIVDRTALELFMGAFAGGEGSTMYKAIVDTKTRKLDVGATAVWASVIDDPGQPVYLGVESVSSSKADEANLRAIRDLVQAELSKIAGLPDGSPELAAFDDRVKARIVEARRGLDKVLDTPPQFGTRGIGDWWIRALTELNREPGFKKALSFKEAYDRAEALAMEPKNPWRDRIAAWGLLDAPYGVMAKASPALRETLDKERDARIAAELARLLASYGTKDAAAALKRREGEIEQADAEIAKAEASVPMPPFVADPPMTADDSLVYTQTKVQGVPAVVSTFETMKSSTVTLALRLDGVAEQDLPYLSLLPQLLREVGIVRDGKPIPYDEMRDRLRREVLDLSAYFGTSYTTGRAELLVSGSGNDVEETQRVIGWMRDLLTSPDWRPENLARIRDVVNRRATELHQVMTGPEERWVSGTAEAYRRQDSALLAHTASFLSRAHDAFRVSWSLEGADPALAKFLTSLADAGKRLDRATLAKLAQALAKVDVEANPDKKPEAAIAAYVAAARALPEASRAKVPRAGRELGQLLGDLPDGSLAADWAYLTNEMAKGAAKDPREALDAFRRVLAAVLHAPSARLATVGSSRTQGAVAGDVLGLVSILDASAVPPAAHGGHVTVTARARARGAAVFDDQIAALVNPSTANGALVASSPLVTLDETSDAALVDFLAVNVLSGTGSHGFYKRVWGAGLSYGGGINANPNSGRLRLYFERSPDLPQLLRFIDGEVRSTPADPRFVDYAIANTFYARTADTYEDRADSMATDLADGFTPERVKGFRARLLAERGKPGLADALHARLIPVDGAIIPTLTPAAPRPEGALWFAVAPEAQIVAYEKELRASRGDKLSVLRLYPRDYWDVTSR